MYCLNWVRRAVVTTIVCVGFVGTLCADSLPVSGNIVYTVHAMDNLSGGNAAGAAVMDNALLTLTVDESVLGADRQACVSIVNNMGGRINQDFAGTVGAVSNIEVSESRAHLYEAWIQQGGSWGSIRAGWYDFNSEFYVQSAALNFVHSLFGIGTEASDSGLWGPSIFPYTSVGMRVKADFGSNCYAQLAVLDAIPGLPGNPADISVDINAKDGVFAALETGYDNVITGAKVSMGYWTYSEPFTKNDDSGTAINSGLYGMVQHSMPGFANTTGFFRAGIANAQVSRSAWSAALGVTVDDVLPGCDDTQIGTAIYAIGLSNSYQADPPIIQAIESGIEMYAMLPVCPGLIIQPDFQVILNPGATGAHTAVVAGVSVRYTANF